jgi:hypothetical protein
LDSSITTVLTQKLSFFRSSVGEVNQPLRGYALAQTLLKYSAERITIDDAAAGVAGADDSKTRAVLDPHRRPLFPQRLPQGGRFRFEAL